MKKQILSIVAIITIYSEIKPAHSGGAIAGAAVGGLVGGYILGRLIPRGEKGQEYYDHKEKKELQKEANKHKKEHLNNIKRHQKELDRLKKEGQENSDAAKYQRTQITHHESILAQIEQELREIFHPDKKLKQEN